MSKIIPPFRYYQRVLPVMSSSAEHAFNDHAAALRALGEALTTASSIRYEASRGAATSEGIPNPTLDTVLDPKRAEVSASITRAALAIWPMTATILEHVDSLNAAIAAWSGEPASPKELPA